ncbi:MAG TPA: UDP-N-acetylmuramate:L-alanyl-gamma-D-glutamyl-meso-diaminopimelate ligase, partial [Pseudomonadales bacterium]
EMGYQVSGCDANVYPPMSSQLEKAGITLDSGFDPAHLAGREPDLVVIGNAMSRGNALVEYVLDKGLAYTSGPQFLHDYVIRDKWVLAVAGTHGKTTTSAMLAWILEYAGMKPGFLIGGVVQDFPFSARIGDSVFFVVEADEYDTAFFDKRSKFLHYQPRTLVLNNLEFDHADIFDNLDAIKRQFHHLLRIVPSTGRVIVNADDANLADVLAMGCWSQQQGFGGAGDWQVAAPANGQPAIISRQGGEQWPLQWQLLGEHNRLNALAAIAAAEHVGVRPQTAIEALAQFRGVKRRLELIADIGGICVYDDFAHHPTAIATTLAGLRQEKQGRIVAVIEPRSNTMRMGVHRQQLAGAVQQADRVFWYLPPDISWQPAADAGRAVADINRLLDEVMACVIPGDQVVIMSNGGFAGFHGRLKAALEQRYAQQQ